MREYACQESSDLFQLLVAFVWPFPSSFVLEVKSENTAKVPRLDIKLAAEMFEYDHRGSVSG